MWCLRWRACAILVQFVLSSNLNRRHLMPGQMAVIVAQAQDWSKAHGRGGNGSNQHTKEQKSDAGPLQTGDDPAGYSNSCNGPRRHLPVGQRAVCIALNQDWSKAQGKGGNGSNQHEGKEQSGRSTTLLNQTQTTADRQALSGASEKTQRLADKIARTDPELALRVAQGEMGCRNATPLPQIE